MKLISRILVFLMLLICSACGQLGYSASPTAEEALSFAGYPVQDNVTAPDEKLAALLLAAEGDGII